MLVQNWQGEAFNQVPDSKNEIHGDKVAKDFGFKGGLVPGVTVSAYLIHPAVEAFGMDYLERGYAHVRVNKPLYDNEMFEVQITEQSEHGYSASIVPPDRPASATAEVKILEAPPAPPVLRGDELLEKDAPIPDATPENMQRLMQDGCKAMHYRWNAEHNMNTYLRDRSKMAKLHQDGYANPSFILGISNWILSGNAYVNPWVHMETRSQNYQAMPAGVRVLSEMQITDLFNRKGHEFVDATVNLFNEDTGDCFTSIELRAIYRLRGL